MAELPAGTPRHLTISKTARYYALNNPSSTTQRLWIVLHGYGQLAGYFLNKFRPLAKSPTTCIVAPEGLHRFYHSGFRGRVGASWMTKEDRLNDIEDYVRYLNTLYDHLCSLAGHNTFEVNLLGFSQGAATASRWCVDGNAPVKHLILWSGLFPPDLPVEHTASQLAAVNVLVVYGTKDPYQNKENTTSLLQTLEQNGINPAFRTFNGGHEIDREALIELNRALYPL